MTTQSTQAKTMFRYSSLQPAKIKGTIRINRRVSQLGLLTDADGKRWHVEAIFGSVICAVPYNEVHPYFTDTSGAPFDWVSQTWEPYQTEVV